MIALVKSSTKRPAKRTEVMRVKPFVDYFQKLKDNHVLPLKVLRLKTVTLLALTFMTRPSDLAPRAELFDPSKNSVYQCNLSRDQCFSRMVITITF